MLELVLVVIAVLALSEPTVSIVFALAAVGISAWKQNKLRLQLQDLAELNTKQNDALHRELLDLKRQIAAAPPIAEPGHETPQSVRPAVHTESVKTTAPVTPAGAEAGGTGDRICAQRPPARSGR